jgi:hypothetical protein
VGPVLHIVASVATRGRYYFSSFPTDVQTEWRPTNKYIGPRPTIAPAGQEMA